jgi:hypothetical protein
MPYSVKNSPEKLLNFGDFCRKFNRKLSVYGCQGTAAFGMRRAADAQLERCCSFARGSRELFIDR